MKTSQYFSFSLNVIYKNFSLLSLVFSFIISHQSLQAQNNCTWDPDRQIYVNPDLSPCINTVVSAVPFLRIVSDARSAGMGDAGIAISPDANSIHFNASKLVLAEEDFSISASYTPWLKSLGLNDVYLAYLSGYAKIDKLSAIGASLRFFSLGDIPFTDTNGEPLIIGRPREYEIAIAYSRKLSDKFTTGLTAKFISSNLASGQQVNSDLIQTAKAGAADLSFTYQTELKSNSVENSQLTIGLALTNIGSKITYINSINKDFLPANFGLGAAWSMNFDKFNSLTFTAEMNKLMVPTPYLCEPDQSTAACIAASDERRNQSPISAIFSSFGDAPEGFSEEMKEISYSIGVEYWYDQQFAVRAGYFGEHVQKGGRKFITAGFGLKYNIFGLNFSYLVPTTNQRNPLDSTLRFSLLFDFGSYDQEG